MDITPWSGQDSNPGPLTSLRNTLQSIFRYAKNHPKRTPDFSDTVLIHESTRNDKQYNGNNDRLNTINKQGFFNPLNHESGGGPFSWRNLDYT